MPTSSRAYLVGDNSVLPTSIIEDFEAGGSFECFVHGFRCDFTPWHLGRPPCRNAGLPLAPILIIFEESLAQSSQSLVYSLRAGLSGRHLALLVPGNSSVSLTQMLSLDSGVRYVTAKGTSLLDDFGSLDPTELVPLLWDCSIADAFQRLFAAFRDAVESETERLRSHRLIAQKQLQRLQSRQAAPSSPAAGSATLLSTLQGFESQSLDRLQYLVNSDPNGIKATLNASLNSIAEMDSEPSARGIAVFFQNSAIAQMLAEVRDGLQRFFCDEFLHLVSGTVSRLGATA